MKMTDAERRAYEYSGSAAQEIQAEYDAQIEEIDRQIADVHSAIEQSNTDKLFLANAIADAGLKDTAKIEAQYVAIQGRIAGANVKLTRLANQKYSLKGKKLHAMLAIYQADYANATELAAESGVRIAFFENEQAIEGNTSKYLDSIRQICGQNVFSCQNDITKHNQANPNN
jgi:hypothetical protein